MRDDAFRPLSILTGNGMVLNNGPMTFSTPSTSIVRPEVTIPIVGSDDKEDWSTDNQAASTKA